MAKLLTQKRCNTTKDQVITKWNPIQFDKRH